MTRTGIFGGTFSPPHRGHIRAAAAFVSEMKLDRLLVIPACIPPHKSIDDPGPDLRLEMTRAAFSDNAGFSSPVKVSDYEIRKSGVSYTVDTLEHLSDPDTELFLLCGGDMFESLESWREPERIFSLASVVGIMREDGTEQEMRKYAERYRKKYGAKCYVLGERALEVSSTLLRTMIKRGENTEEYLSPEVRRIIERERLYR